MQTKTHRSGEADRYLGWCRQTAEEFPVRNAQGQVDVFVQPAEHGFVAIAFWDNGTKVQAFGATKSRAAMALFTKLNAPLN